MWSLDDFERTVGSTLTDAFGQGSVMFEFEVDDVDAEYERLRGYGVEWVKLPTTQPWGNRSIYFRDPDGNLVNFYARVTNRV